MNWLSRLTVNGGSITTAKISHKELQVSCSARADRALAERDQPLVVEIELAFACFARKTVRFHETSASQDAIKVNEKLMLLITTIIPDTCETATQAKGTASAPLRNFIPKWVRIDYVKGRWVGEYGL